MFSNRNLKVAKEALKEAKPELDKIFKDCNLKIVAGNNLIFGDTMVLQVRYPNSQHSYSIVKLIRPYFFGTCTSKGIINKAKHLKTTLDKLLAKLAKDQAKLDKKKSCIDELKEDFKN